MTALALLVLLLCAPLRAESETYAELRRRHLDLLARPDFPELSLTVLESDLAQARLRPEERLSLARELAAARPSSPILQAALAKAYCADRRPEAGRRILARRRTLAGDPVVERLWIDALARCGEAKKAFAALRRVVERDPNPHQAARALQKMLALADAAGGRASLDGMRALWRRRVEEGSRELGPYRLLAELYARDKDPGLEELCERALRLFPEEEAFAGFLADSFLERRLWDRAEALWRGRMRPPAPAGASPYYGLADVLLRSGRPDEALRTLREARALPGLRSEESADLDERLRVLEAAGPARSGASAPPDCAFREEPGWREVDCGGERLAYSLDQGRFTGQDDPARAAPLACRLLERVEQTRGRGPAEAADLTPGVRELLKAAGYLD